MSDLKPINREEAILSGEDLKPLSRKEYFLKKLGKGGSGGGGTDSSLPSYASEDIGKVLTVSTENPVMTTVQIVPEQTVTLTEGVGQLLNTIEYTGEEAPVLGGDYVGWVYRPEASPATGIYVYSDPVLGDSKAIMWTTISGQSGIAIGSIDDKSYLFQPDSSISDVSVTVSATATMSVVPTVSSVVVPTQNVTFNEEGRAPLSNVSISPEDVQPGTSVTATIIENGITHVFTLPAAELGAALVYIVLDSDGNQCMFAFREDINSWMMLFGNTNTGPFSGEATVSIEGQAPKPKVKWESKDGRGALYLSRAGIKVNGSYKDITDAIDNGKAVYLKNVIDGKTTVNPLADFYYNETYSRYEVSFLNVSDLSDPHEFAAQTQTSQLEPLSF